MPELPLIVTVEDTKNPVLLVRILRAITEQISTLGNRLDAIVRSIRIPSVAFIRNSLQSDGAFPLNLTNLRGVVADPQPAAALRYDIAPTGLVLQNLRDTQFVLVKNGAGYDLCTVIGGNPNSLFTLIAGASGGSSMTTNTAQTVTGAKTFNVGTLLLGGSGGANQVLKQTSVGGAVTVAQLSASELSNGTTGSGTIVLSTAPSVTSINVSDGNLQISGQRTQSFELLFYNPAGTLQHTITCESRTGTASNWSSQISGASTILTNTPLISNIVDFASGVGVDAAATSIVHLNTAEQVSTPTLHATAQITRNSTGVAAPLVQTRILSKNVNGITRNRLVLQFANSTSDVAYAVTTANIGLGTYLAIRIDTWII